MNDNDDNLKGKTQKALAWSFADKFGQQLLYFISGVILARILNAEDYGKTGVLAIFIALAGILIDSGFASALIRKKNATQADYSTIFYFNLGFSLVLYAILFFSAPYIAIFFGLPDLTLICRIFFLTLLFNATALIQQTLLFKNICFTQCAKVNIFSLAISSVIAIILAYSGLGVWALVAQTVGLAFFRALFFWSYGSWRPTYEFRTASIKEFFGYSSNLIATGILNNVFNYIYPIIIGKFYGISNAGYYTQANKYQDIASSFIGNVFRSVGFPVLSSIQEDKVRLKRVFRKYIRAMAFFIFPVMSLMIVVSHPLILILLKEQWLPSVPYFRILCISGAFAPFIILFYDLFNSIGRPGLNLHMEIWKKAFLLAGIVLLYSYGIISLIWLWVCYTLLSLTATVILDHIYTGYHFKEFLKDVSPYLVLALFCTVICAFLYSLLPTEVLRLLVVPPIYIIIYLGISKILRMEMINEFLQMIKKEKTNLPKNNEPLD